MQPTEDDIRIATAYYDKMVKERPMLALYRGMLIDSLSLHIHEHVEPLRQKIEKLESEINPLRRI
jgi:hypothetical protein